MKEIKIHKSSRGLWLFIDGKHKKTVPYKYESIIEDNVIHLSLVHKRLSDSERETLDKLLFAEVLQDYLSELENKEIHLFRMVKNALLIGTRKVFSRYGKRYELCFDNKLNLKCYRKMYSKFPVKLPVAFLNY